MGFRRLPLLSRLRPVATIVVLAGLSWFSCIQPPSASAAIPSQLTSLRPIKGISYQPAASNDPLNGTGTTFDQDYWNTDFPALWGTDASGDRNDLDAIQGAGLNLLHLYDWNAQRDHTPFLDAANQKGIKVMVPISNYAAQTIVGHVCQTCPMGYNGAFSLVESIFNQVYLNGGVVPHPAVAMWGIFNEYDLNKIDPVNVAFVIQSILTLEREKGIPPANRLPITAPVSFAIFNRADPGRDSLSPEQLAAFEAAEQEYLSANPNQTDATIPSSVLAILAISHALENAQTSTSYTGLIRDFG